MRKIKKLVVTFLAICLMCPGLSVITEAATAELRFADPSTTVGAEVEVKTKLSSVSSLQSMEATLTYDKSELKFISGDNATAKDGTIKISWTGTGTTAEFNLKFQALKEGTSNIEVSSATGTATDGSTLEITQGSSAVTIGAGDPSLIKDDTEDQSEDSKTTVADGPVVKVNGKKYVVGSEFSEELIPDGFKKGEMTFEGSKYTVITQEASGINAMYLTEKSSGDSDFFLYNSDDGSFSPFEEVEIAKDRYIIPLMNDGKLKLSSRYQKTTLTLNGKEFDTWQDTKDAEYYIVYALNSDGEKTTYRYDTTDGTYQKYSPESQGTTSGNKNNGKGLWGKILNFVEEFLDIVVIIAIALFLLVLLMFIVTAIKLRHRDLELDDLYDEYGIDMDEEEAVLKEKKKEEKKEEKAKKASKKVKKKPAKKYYDEDEFEGYDDEDDFDDEDPWITENIAKAMDTSNMKSKKSSKKKKPSKGVRALDETGPAIRKPVKKINLEDTNDFEAFTPLDEEAFDNFEGYYSEDDDYDLFGAGYDDDDLFDATADLLSNHPEKRRSHAEMDDTFKMDVIDLD
ncbi:MAG: cohesin domain-containing protein [Dorea longicatena]